MDLNEIKSIIEIDGGKFIIVENDKPKLVVISFDDYKKYLETKVGQNQSLFEDIKQDSGNKASEEKDETEENRKSAFAKASSYAPAGATADKTADKGDDELTIDDLPL